MESATGTSKVTRNPSAGFDTAVRRFLHRQEKKPKATPLRPPTARTERAFSRPKPGKSMKLTIENLIINYSDMPSMPAR
jgi:hypothetical protein